MEREFPEKLDELSGKLVGRNVLSIGIFVLLIVFGKVRPQDAFIAGLIFEFGSHDFLTETT